MLNNLKWYLFLRVDTSKGNISYFLLTTVHCSGLCDDKETRKSDNKQFGNTGYKL